MKLLIFTDLHGNRSALDEIDSKSKKVDILICAGDFTIFEQDIDQILSKLEKIGKTILIVHGNHEDESLVRKLCDARKNCKFIHNRNFVFGDYMFIGWGGGGFSFKDKQFEKNIPKFKKWSSGKKLILVTHAPPYNTKIDKVWGEHAGNKSIRKFILEVKPLLAVSGHLHECVGEDKIGKTLVINPGHKGKVIDI